MSLTTQPLTLEDLARTMQECFAQLSDQLTGLNVAIDMMLTDIASIDMELTKLEYDTALIAGRTHPGA